MPCPGCDRCNGGYIIRLSAGRPTSAHEHVFLLSKRKTYFYDADAVTEPSDHPGLIGKSQKVDYRPDGTMPGMTQSNSIVIRGATRNLRNVWTIPTHPYSDAHFATFPPALVERCIRAGTSERGACSACGAPWVRITDTSYERNRHGHSGRTDTSGSNGWDGGGYPNLRRVNTTTGWAVSCACEADVVPCTVLDCFSGAGTSLLVADRLGRDAIGIDLSHQYVEMTRERITADCPLFTSWAPAETDAQDERMRDLFSVAAD